MRTLKFRVWDTEKKEFSFPKDMDDLFGGFVSNPPKNSLRAKYIKNIEPIAKFYLQDLSERYSIQQFTGLIDKNNKEIYEGDILKFNKHYPKLQGEVKYDLEMACYVIEYDMDSFVFLSDFPLNLEITGNILENPDLLNK